MPSDRATDELLHFLTALKRQLYSSCSVCWALSSALSQVTGNQRQHHRSWKQQA
jgi:homoserine trans-succinylase